MIKLSGTFTGFNGESYDSEIIVDTSGSFNIDVTLDKSNDTLEYCDSLNIYTSDASGTDSAFWERGSLKVEIVEEEQR